MAIFRNPLKRIYPAGIPWPFSGLYDAFSRTRAFQAHYERLAEDIAAFGTEGTLLDIGTGPGRLLSRLHARCPGLRLVGVDISPAMVAQGRRNMEAAGLLACIEIREGAADRLPFPDASFDMVVSSASLHHWDDPVAVINEIHRVLRPGGRALLSDLVKKTPKRVREEAHRDFGRFRMMMLWLHSLSEPVYDAAAMESFARASRFGGGETAFVGLLCRLALVKRG